MDAPNAGDSTMKLRLDKNLRFWVDVAYEDIKSDHPKLTKSQLVAQILRKYEGRGDAMRYFKGEKVPPGRPVGGCFGSSLQKTMPTRMRSGLRRLTTTRSQRPPTMNERARIGI